MRSMPTTERFVSSFNVNTARNCKNKMTGAAPVATRVPRFSLSRAVVVDAFVQYEYVCFESARLDMFALL
jgi:hypothetical protein